MTPIDFIQLDSWRHLTETQMFLKHISDTRDEFLLQAEALAGVESMTKRVETLVIKSAAYKEILDYARRNPAK